MNTKLLLPVAFALLAGVGFAQNNGFDEVTHRLARQLEDAKSELSKERKRIEGLKVPLAKQLNALELKLEELRLESQQRSSELTSQTLKVTNLKDKIEKRQKESNYISTLFSDYRREFETRLHIAEKPRYAKALEKARLASQNDKLEPVQVLSAEDEFLGTSIERLHELVGGCIFPGRAAGDDGELIEGKVGLIGPAAYFASEEDKQLGTAEERLNALEASIAGFGDPADSAAVAKVMSEGEGLLPFDATLGNAHKIAETEETLLEHVQKGGVVMIPIAAMAGIALLIALFKWLTLSMVRRPSKRRMNALLDAVERGDDAGAVEQVRHMRGPVGQMLESGVANLDQPKELIEEVMYERVMVSRLKLQRMLPFIAICAAAAPLLGLLGTVTGIINTFKMITLFGSGDVKSLSGGISEALITTKFGLIVAIPSLLLHAFLSRKARAIIGQMERAGVALVNRVSAGAPKSPSGDQIRAEVESAIGELLGPLVSRERTIQRQTGLASESEDLTRDMRQAHA